MVDRIDAETTRESMESRRPVVIDVLGPNSFHRRHLPNAINIPLDAPNFEDQVRQAVPNKDQPIIVYCASETCTASPTAAKRIEAMGYTKVSDFEAGLEGWHKAGFDFDQPTAAAV